MERDDRVSLDFTADPEIVRLVVRAEHLTHGFFFNPAFASEISLIDPLPHQRIAVYEHMLPQPRLHMLLADDAGAGKTIMSGLYIQAMLLRRLIRRVLIVPPAGLVDNWRKELRALFNLHFEIIPGSAAKAANPFVGPDSNLAIVSIDTLRGDRMFARLQEPGIIPYDLVIFDEAHKLSANRLPDMTFYRTGRYKLAEAIAGVMDTEPRWTLPWSANHLLLLTATPHMGKDYPYYCLWRLLEPEIFSTYEAFEQYPKDLKKRYFIRRTKEEMINFEEKRIFPMRASSTFKYDLSTGVVSEQTLYERVTDYIQNNYNKAQVLNRSAARLAMSIFQRRLASSTYAILRSLERRGAKLQDYLDQYRSQRIDDRGFIEIQEELNQVSDPLDTMTADEEESDDGSEQNERKEKQLEGATIATTIKELEIELKQVQDLIQLAREVYEIGEDKKFEKLYEVIMEPQYKNEKILVFTEHRDTQNFIVRRLEGLGFTGKVALIHGGMNYEERGEQVEFFRLPEEDGGAQYLIATDAAGEGINLQFCWFMVNYDIPWNPARLEQRMGRVHRYKQKHDVQVANLVAGNTREGHVLDVLLEKLENIRKNLGSDKVFDVIGKLFEGQSLKDYMNRILVEKETTGVKNDINARITEKSVEDIVQKEREMFGRDEVRSRLPEQRQKLDQERLMNILPGYARIFLERSSDLVNLEIAGDIDGIFSLQPIDPTLFWPFNHLITTYPQDIWDQLTLHKPKSDANVVFLRPGEPFFDAYRASFVARYGRDALRGAIFIDPYAVSTYFLHLGVVSIVRKADPGSKFLDYAENLETLLIAIKVDEEGTAIRMPVEYFFFLKTEGEGKEVALLQAGLARDSLKIARTFAIDILAHDMITKQRSLMVANASCRKEFIARGFEHLEADLLETRAKLVGQIKAGNAKANSELDRVKQRQRDLSDQKSGLIDHIMREPDLIDIDDIHFFAHAIVIPSTDPEDKERHDKVIERVAVKYAIEHEQQIYHAEVIDVSTPELALAAGLLEHPGFDLISHRANGETRNIEVKGRAMVGKIDVSETEWTTACNLRQQFWLYVVYDCATVNPHLHCVQDPFGKLIFKARGGVVIDEEEIFKTEEKI